MTRADDQALTIEVSAWRQGSYVVLDWRVFRPALSGAIRRLKRSRRVMVRTDVPLTEPTLTALVGRMCTYVLSTSRGTSYVPRHLPWREVGATGWSVPPGGGEGGASPAPDEGLTERRM
jgi:hypothetical protein